MDECIPSLGNYSPRGRDEPLPLISEEQQDHKQKAVNQESALTEEMPRPRDPDGVPVPR